MTRLIGLISDVHASPVPLRQALEIFTRHKVDEIICAGDIAGYFDSLDHTIQLLEQYDCKTVIGNHDQEFLDTYAGDVNSAQYRYLQALPETLELEFETKKIYVVHANPPSSQHGGIKLLDQYGELILQQQELWQENLQGFEYDVLIVGHTHQVYAEKLGKVLVINPGSSQFNHSCMLLSLPDMKVQTFALENREIDRAWNFSKLYRGDNRYPTRKT